MGVRRRSSAFIFCVLLLMGDGAARGQSQTFVNAARVNRRLAGRVEAFVKDRQGDRRIYSPMLAMPRDLYVYLPPDYQPDRSYSLILLLHGAFGDEHSFLETPRIKRLDELIRCGQVPPVIVACPDGTYTGRNRITTPHSLDINGCGGPYEDHLLREVIPFLAARYAIRPDREAHALLGLSAGGLGAMNLAIRYRDFFGSVATLAAPLNLRISNQSGDYFEDFRPETYRWSTRYDPDLVVARFVSGLIRIRARAFLEPVFGSEGDVMARIAQVNPADLLFTADLRPGQLNIYVNYPGRDNLNFDAQARSFAWLAAGRGIPLTLVEDPEGDHTLDYFRENQARALLWLGPYLPPPAAIPRLESTPILGPSPIVCEACRDRGG